MPSLWSEFPIHFRSIINISPFSDEYLTRTLSGEYAHNKMFVTVDQNAIRVSVQACHDAIIGLATDTGDENLVHTEVILGAENNTFVWIRDLVNR